MELEVWVDGAHVAMLSENRRQLTMVYTGSSQSTCWEGML